MGRCGTKKRSPRGCLYRNVENYLVIVADAPGCRQDVFQQGFAFVRTKDVLQSVDLFLIQQEDAGLSGSVRLLSFHPGKCYRYLLRIICCNVKLKSGSNFVQLGNQIVACSRKNENNENKNVPLFTV